MIKYQISTETAISLDPVQIFPLQMLCSTEAIMDQQHHSRPLVPPPLLPESSSHLHTVSRFLLSTTVLLPGPRLRMGCVPMPGDAIRAWSPVLVLCSRVGPAAPSPRRNIDGVERWAGLPLRPPCDVKLFTEVSIFSTHAHFNTRAFVSQPIFSLETLNKNNNNMKFKFSHPGNKKKKYCNLYCYCSYIKNNSLV